MSLKPIREADGKLIIARNFPNFSGGKAAFHTRTVPITPTSDFAKLEQDHPWLLTDPLVAKPDQLIKRRGKGNLLLLNARWPAVKDWIAARMNKEVTVEGVTGVLTNFVVEPFIPHPGSDEYYLSILSSRAGETIFFHHEGGVDVGDVDAKAVKLLVRPGDRPTREEVHNLVSKVPAARQALLVDFILPLVELYIQLNFGLLEINPLVVTPAAGTDAIFPLDLAAKLDTAAEFECGDKWGPVAFPAAFGRMAFPEEDYIRELDSKTGASLKLTVLNKNGRIWTMVAGGGASVLYADTIADLGYASELANYGEYSGAPSETHTFEYAKTILSLMTQTPDPRGKILIIGGGIANFTNVATTFKGIVRALEQFRDTLLQHRVRIYVRRGGPNYQEGLEMMRNTADRTGLSIDVYGPETHLTAIIKYALDEDAAADASRHRDKRQRTAPKEDPAGDFLRAATGAGEPRSREPQQAAAVPMDFGSTAAAAAATTVIPEEQQDPHLFTTQEAQADIGSAAKPSHLLFTSHTRSFVYGMQPRAVQGMLDFDFVCKRKVPSVAAMVYPMSGNHFQKFYFGTSEVLMPVYQTIAQALAKYPEVDTMVNFASSRSVFESMEECFRHPQIRTVAIIAEGVPEAKTRIIIRRAAEKGVTLIGPATVGGIRPGAFRIGNTGGMLDNIVSCKLYRPGSVAYVSRSGGMSNELNNIISRTTNGICEGVAVGGDRYPGTTFIDHLLRFEADPNVKMLVLLGEVGGTDEYDVVAAIRNGRIKKPLVAWCIGTCASLFSYEVQFGHAGAQARGDTETAKAKNEALRSVGAIVPMTFNDFSEAIRATYQSLVQSGIVVEQPEPETPKIPIDYSWAQELGLVRKPAAFVSSICDDRGEELLYAGMPISAVFREEIGIGGVLSLLWFQRRLPSYACRFIEMILMVTADHGPAVSGAHNTIVTARAGKDLVSSLCSGLLTIGPRFGGAIDDAARMFSKAFDAGLTAHQFVNQMRQEHKLIMGIGHRIKSLENPDMRVTIIKEFAKQHFPSTQLLAFAEAVEQITTKKQSTLILNVDGCIGACFVDLLRSCGAFTREEADEYLSLGVLNGLFVVGRSIGFVGHFLDQKRLKQGLYRHPWDDITYV
eukprot:TRINITY_DN1946_c0_g1_i1.p1 TRINITY_DN1946_c0_g1~~TRINITY_DN1946_c0_g1_i1.p1  ORF type:complete len:1122 (-),score=261.03 TRINITY_DN1946_c0_g1_i1:71-3436(-)